MKIFLGFLLCFLWLFAFLGCETVHQTTQKAGEYVGKGTKALGGITEGAAEGYSDKEENPYNR
ncbi:MAG: hypothetical protein J7J25_05870 [Candidatus Omnitrophica bacterium]|nr:hypothetical protein [Candidatus Omnitrophota bacterium]